MEKRTASNWYRWLWLSPLFTIPTLLVLIIYVPDFTYRLSGFSYAIAARLYVLIAILGSSLWHLILLLPALDKKSEFVRWHGRQALLLAGARTAIPLAVGLAEPFALFRLSDYLLTITSVLIIVWFFGTRWGQKQASRGTCSLMRHFRPEKPSFPSETIIKPEPIVDEKTAEAIELDIESLIDIIRYSNDPEQRRKALSELEKLGMVNQL